MPDRNAKLEGPELLAQELAELLAKPESQAGPRRVVRLTSNAPTVDLLSWLRRQREGDKIFWSDREHAFAIAGVGAASMKMGRSVEGLFEEMRSEIASSEDALRFYGGFQFDPGRSGGGEWAPFGAYRFVIPQFELGCRGGEYHLACNVLLPDTALDRALAGGLLERVRSMQFSGEALDTKLPSVISRKDRPDFHTWCDSVRDLLDTFESGSLEKVVLARESNFELSGEAEPLALLQALMMNTSYSYHYMFQPESGSAFVGASPERLYKRAGSFLESEALAGTRPRGTAPEEDGRLGEELLDSEKERQEHRFVLDSIRELFNARCSEIHVGDEVELLLLRHCQHLLTRIEGTLSSAECDAELLSGLHPTPAVGGIPRTEAIERIRKMEPFERGWYTGPVGWVGRDATEFAVAIRSALVRGDSLSVYAGAGIVPGSEPQAEWDELENKIADFRGILEESAAPRETVQP